MIISDLNHLEVVTQETNIVGGLVFNFGGQTIVMPSVAIAQAGADANVIANLMSESITYTSANAVPGLFSSSKSISIAKGVSY